MLIKREAKPEIHKRSEIVILKTPVEIGTKYSPKSAQFIDTDNGEFWARYPDYSCDMLLLQKALLTHV